MTLASSTYPYANQYLELKLEDYKPLVELAIKEDCSYDDVTTNSIFPAGENNLTKAFIFTKEQSILCGSPLVQYVASQFKSLKVELLAKDGNEIVASQKCFLITGNINHILKFERIALNFLSYMSGISSQTKKIVKQLIPYNVKLLDTRKTLPGYRMLSKYAVAIGGGFNHRTNLQQMGMIKDNHIVKAGSIAQAISIFKKKNQKIPLEIEVDTISQLEEVLQVASKTIIDCVLLDNMNNQEMKKASNLITNFNLQNNSNILTEASGGFTWENLNKLKETGVNYVSMSSITTAAKPIDFSLEVV